MCVHTCMNKLNICADIFPYSVALPSFASLSDLFPFLQILTKALMRMPETDFMLCLYLLPVAVQKDAKIDALKSLWDKLETCEFKVLWAWAHCLSVCCMYRCIRVFVCLYICAFVYVINECIRISGYMYTYMHAFI